MRVTEQAGDPDPAGDARTNRRYWDRDSDDYQERHASQLNRKELAWGVWGLPESELRILGDVAGRDVLELGCGAAQWSIFLARRGALPVGLDNSRQQLLHARRLMEEFGVGVPIVHASAERVPFADASFDLVFCDHGAMSFADPRRSVAEAARVLRPGGLLAFNMASPMLFLSWSEWTETVEEKLHRPYFGMDRFQYVDGLVEYQLPYGEWIRLFLANGLEVEDLVELCPPEDAQTTYPDYVPLEWARRWPAENVWKARKPPASSG
jgi:SAM-dependent methyltransferase